MPVPPYNTDGVIPPYIGPNGPGGAYADMSPYVATCMEVVQAFGTTANRLQLLRGWFAYRRDLRNIGIVDGFQWLDGSFLEDKTPRDLDLATFFRLPAAAQSDQAAFIQANFALIDRSTVTQLYGLDHFFINLDAGADSIVTLTRYFFGLFAHRRGDGLWKGMLEVKLDDTSERAAFALASAAVQNSAGSAS